jgi:uncharacterized protein YgiM (DUF1202 family)
MRKNFHVSKLLILMGLCLFVVLPTIAQSPMIVTPDAPVSIELNASDAIISVEYQATHNQMVIFQAMSDIAHPTLQVLKDGVEVAKYQPVDHPIASINLKTYLTAGTYTIRVSALNEFSSTARVFVGVLPQSDVQPEYMRYGQSVSGTIQSDAPILLYDFDGVAEESQVIIKFTPVGADVRIHRADNEEIWFKLNSELIGGRAYFPPNDGAYQIVVTSNQSQPINYVICYVSISAGCDGSPSSVDPTNIPTSADSCTATPINHGGANVRQSASTAAPIIGALAGGQSVAVIGIDPTGTWYQVVFNSQIGWASLAAVVGNGDCVGLPPINPPAIPTAVPQPDTAVPSITPLPPTPTDSGPTPTATATSPNGGPTPTATATPPNSGPTPTATATQPMIGLTFVPITLIPPVITLIPNTCEVTFSADEYIYTTTNDDMSYVLHQATAGTTYNVTARKNNTNWYRVNFYDGWWHNTVGTSGVMSGNCNNLPLIINGP